MDIITGLEEEKARENGMMNTWLHRLKMLTMRIGAYTAALAFMLN
jgi:hypothetical protein